MLCPCGINLKNSGNGYQFRRFDETNKVIYAICVHGYTVVDTEDVDIDIHKLIKDADLRGELDEPQD